MAYYMAESLWHCLGHFTGEINTRFARNYIIDSFAPLPISCYQSAGIISTYIWTIVYPTPYGILYG